MWNEREPLTTSRSSVRLRHACSLPRRDGRHEWAAGEFTSEREENRFDFRLLSDKAKAMTLSMAVPRRATPHESSRSANTFQHTPPSLAIPDLHPVAFQFEGARLVGLGEIR